MHLRVLSLVFLTVFSALTFESANAGAMRSGFNSNSLDGNDDDSAGFVSFGFDANFFGATFSGAYLNNNGNMTFNEELFGYTPFGLTGDVDQPIIAPFFADVDTRVGALMQYGTGTVGGRAAFGVTWDNVGYYDHRDDKLNKFQVILVERGDTGVGNFDIEFNYDQIQWETGEASDGVDGLGGTSAHVGFSNGAGTFFELAGSGVNGAFLDVTDGPNTLITHQLGAAIDGAAIGRYTFLAREGSVSTVEAVPEPSSVLMWSALGVAAVVFRRRACRK